MIKPSDLKTQSNNTFFDNDQGLINPGAHRAFNDAVIDYIQGGQAATFVVDSDEAMIDWAGAFSGHDYTHVLIKPGTYNSSVTVNLSGIGTKTVVGMGGNLIKFTSQYGVEGADDSLIIGLNIEVNAPIAIGFYKCSNLLGCTALVKSSTSTNAAFSACNYLSNCTGYNASNTGGQAYIFINCKYMTNCYAYSNVPTATNPFNFSMCKSLTNCFSEAVGGGNATAFHYCESVTNCVGKASAGVGAGVTGVGFAACKRLVNCNGVGESAGNGKGYGFQSCRGMMLCSADSPSTTSTYNTCYMGSSSTTNVVAESAAGGYNWQS